MLELDGNENLNVCVLRISDTELR